MEADFWIVIQFWIALLLVGVAALPLTIQLFSTWFDRGYLFSKAVGMATVTFVVFVFGMYRIVPFSVESIWIALGAVFVAGLWVNVLHKVKRTLRGKFILYIVIEEIFFLIALLFWSWVKGHEPSIHGLEKFMDYGFMQSILNSAWFPAPDMWYAGSTINYYYFGHTVVALLTKLSGLDLAFTFNLMLAAIFAFCLTMSFSIGIHLTKKIHGGILTAFLVTLAGNMQTIYAFTKGYIGEDVKPFWTLLWSLKEIYTKLPEGLERYWYANATRFIPYTIHEFPSYSFVVSDVHGHVMSIPFTLLAIALLIEMFSAREHKFQFSMFNFQHIFYGLLVAVLLMTNALDGPIYLGLFLVLYIIFNVPSSTAGRQFSIFKWKHWATPGVVISAAVIASIPFMSHFSSFVTGLAVNCPPAFLANQKLGPLLFEGVDKCQHSPLWMVWLLWGFFLYCGGYLVVKIFKFSASPAGRQFSIFKKKKNTEHALEPYEKVLLVFFAISIALIIFPEFFYFKDIYPQHFRSNTMFKLGYQAFMMFSIVSAYTIIKYFRSKLFIVLLIPQLLLVSVYPIFSVRSYFNSLRVYKGINGVSWFEEQYPDDFAAIQFLKRQYSNGSSSGIFGAINSGRVPVLIEADGDSYTDYERYSVLTGFPTIIGWAVHEWLWRGTYDVVAPRREEVRIVYESGNSVQIQEILRKYDISYIIVGTLEREKFLNLNTDIFSMFSTVVFSQGETALYKVNRY